MTTALPVLDYSKAPSQMTNEELWATQDTLRDSMMQAGFAGETDIVEALRVADRLLYAEQKARYAVSTAEIAKSVYIGPSRIHRGGRRRQVAR